jgi:hypothetical protein
MAKIVDMVFDGESLYLNGDLLQAGDQFALGLGSIEYRDTRKAGKHLVRFSGSGKFSYTLKLRQPGTYRMGARYGHRIKRAEEEPDPVRRLLREFGHSVARLEEVDNMEAVEFRSGGRSCHHASLDHGWYDLEWVAPAHAIVNVVEEGARAPADHINEHHRGCKVSPDTVCISGALAAGQFRYRRYMNGCVYRTMDRLVVERNAPREEAAAQMRVVLNHPADY